MIGFIVSWLKTMHSEELDRILWRHLASLPYFRGFLRAIEDRFIQEIAIETPVLDLGSGDGHFASVAFKKKLDVGLDPWREPTLEARDRGAYGLLVLGEGGQIPFGDETFNTITSISVLEHIQEVAPVLSEVARVLAPGGRFVFCVPNHRFPQALSGRKFLEKLGLTGLGASYSRMFNRIARHVHTDSPEVWETRLFEAGLDLLETWDYFPPQALRVLEWGHPLGLPSLISKKLFGRWVLIPKRWNLAIPWRWTRKYMDDPRSSEGVCSFFIARRPA
ncbi:MAG: class I SAM-dependent methyltransferase [Chloroflexi bacterium]|nr:class I SAM-dependent methyltransferase [Chloroflexota bacterium]